jgi:hypothetical protein
MDKAVKHTPAMSLPEMGVNINGDFGAKNWRADPPRGMHQRLSLQEKKEAVRRCNAYPKLVDALRRFTTVGAPSDSNVLDEAAALLRELEEEA